MIAEVGSDLRIRANCFCDFRIQLVKWRSVCKSNLFLRKSLSKKAKRCRTFLTKAEKQN